MMLQPNLLTLEDVFMKIIMGEHSDIIVPEEKTEETKGKKKNRKKKKADPDEEKKIDQAQEKLRNALKDEAAAKKTVSLSKENETEKGDEK